MIAQWSIELQNAEASDTTVDDSSNVAQCAIINSQKEGVSI